HHPALRAVRVRTDPGRGHTRGSRCGHARPDHARRRRGRREHPHRRRRTGMSTQTIESPQTQTLNPTTLDKPAFLLCLPFSHSADTPNNIWMEELSEAERAIDRRQALRQYLGLYHYL